MRDPQIPYCIASPELQMSACLANIDKETTNTQDKVREEDDFKVYINEGEMERIHEWVKRMPDIETGGDLFGLWIDERTAVVQFVLGPGKGCRRTTTSFFQDTDYLKRTGEYLTEKYGLCNIGQWHSHHKIPLFVPSVGDCYTVCNNMSGLGMGRYIVFIANIRNTNIDVNCFLFGLRVGQEVPFQQGEFENLPGESPFRLNKLVLKTIEDSAENLRDEVGFPKSTDENTQIKMINIHGIEQLSTAHDSHHAESLQFGQERKQGSPVISQPTTVEEGFEDNSLNNITNTGRYVFQRLWGAFCGPWNVCQFNRGRYMR